jgi:hypothetical protein
MLPGQLGAELAPGLRNARANKVKSMKSGDWMRGERA